MSEHSHGGRRKGAGRPKGQGKYGEKTKPMRIPVSLLTEVGQFVQNKGYKLPLFAGRVPAGSPTGLDAHVDETVDLNELIVRNPGSTYLVKVTGDSMVDAGINEDDILVVDNQQEPKHRDIVIVSLDNEVTVKRLFKEGDSIMLLPENVNHDPILIKSDSKLDIHGVVTFIIHSAS